MDNQTFENNWCELGCNFVVGCIHHSGYIVSRPCYEGDYIGHTEAESGGKRWRWNVVDQNFDFTINSFKKDVSLDLSDEERLSVIDRLIKDGFADQEAWEKYADF